MADRGCPHRAQQCECALRMHGSGERARHDHVAHGMDQGTRELLLPGWRIGAPTSAHRRTAGQRSTHGREPRHVAGRPAVGARHVPVAAGDATWGRARSCPRSLARSAGRQEAACRGVAGG